MISEKLSILMRIYVNIAAQCLTLQDDCGGELLRCAVSTGKAGVGCEEGSGKTPTGRFVICSKHGENAPLNTVFRGRIPVGTWPAVGGEDAILARILCLDGVEEANANTRARYIYLHGTADTAALGTPVSHGCIRLAPQDAVKLFELCPLGTPVVIQ